MTDPARIILDPTILAGKPVIRGTRLSVEFVIGLMADALGSLGGAAARAAAVAPAAVATDQ